MAEVVRLELRKQFLDELDSKNRDLKKVIKDKDRLMIGNEVTLIDIDLHLAKFDSFYLGLKNLDHFEILPYKNEYLPEIVDKAVYKKKPVTQEKSELKDALIWKTYSDFVESHFLETCILLTNNHTDFCDKNDHSKIHPDLLRDTARFSVVKTSYEFVKQHGTVLESPEHRLRVFLGQTKIDATYVNDLIHEYFGDILNEKIKQKVEALSPNDVMEDQFWHDGYVSGGDVDLSDCYDTGYEAFSESLFISGMISASCDVEVFEYNSMRDAGEDQFASIEETTITFAVLFNFNLSPGEPPDDFEIVSMELV